MANTKKITDRKMRKGVKRSQRKALKAVYGSFTGADYRALRKEPQGVRAYAAAKEAAAKAKAAESDA